MVRRPGREAHHPPASSNKINKNAWSYVSISAYVFMTWYLPEQSDCFAFYFRDYSVSLAQGLGKFGFHKLWTTC